MDSLTFFDKILENNFGTGLSGCYFYLTKIERRKTQGFWLGGFFFLFFSLFSFAIPAMLLAFLISLSLQSCLQMINLDGQIQIVKKVKILIQWLYLGKEISYDRYLGFL